MILQAGDLGILIDFGNNQPGSVLQRKKDGEWRDYEVEGKLLTWPVKLEELEPGRHQAVGE